MRTKYASYLSIYAGLDWCLTCPTSYRMSLYASLVDGSKLFYQIIFWYGLLCSNMRDRESRLVNQNDSFCSGNLAFVPVVAGKGWEVTGLGKQAGADCGGRKSGLAKIAGPIAERAY